MTTFSNNWGRGYLVSCSSFLDILLLPTPVWRKIVKRKSQIRISFHCCYMAAGLMTILSNSVVKEEAILYLARNCSSFLGIPNASGLRRHHWELDVNLDISELPDPGENEWCSGNEILPTECVWGWIRARGRNSFQCEIVVSVAELPGTRLWMELSCRK